MDESKRRVMRFLQKEIETSTALASFLSKEASKTACGWETRESLLNPAFSRRE